jgi:hypothetical protein
MRAMSLHETWRKYEMKISDEENEILFLDTHPTWYRQKIFKISIFIKLKNALLKLKMKMYFVAIKFIRVWNILNNMKNMWNENRLHFANRLCRHNVNFPSMSDRNVLLNSSRCCLFRDRPCDLNALYVRGCFVYDECNLIWNGKTNFWHFKEIFNLPFARKKRLIFI